MYVKHNCRSALVTNENDHIIQMRGMHNHPKPMIQHTSEGIVYKHAGVRQIKVNKKQKDNDVLKVKTQENTEIIIP